jgi:hypothetical protein
MHYEFLHFREFAAFVNCVVSNGHLECGAIYLAPGLPPTLPLYSLDGGGLICTVQIHDDYRRHHTSQTITAFDDDLRFLCQTP